MGERERGRERGSERERERERGSIKISIQRYPIVKFQYSIIIIIISQA